MKKLYGIITAMTTPFYENGEVDFASLKQQTEFLIRSGVNCLYPCGTTGEMLFMTPEQREAVAEAVVKQAAGRVTVFIHTGAVRVEDTVRLSRHAERIGADGVGVVTPPFFGLTEEELVAFYVKVADSVGSDFPVYLYNIPQCAVNDVSVAACERVAAACKNVVGIKYSFADVHRTLDYLQVRGGDFSVLVGFDRLLLPALSMGCGGTVSGASTVFPEPFVAGYRAYQRGDMEEARKQMLTADAVVKLLKAGTQLCVFQAAQQMRGLKGGHVHAPLLDLSKEARAALEQQVAPYVARYPLPDLG